MAGIFGVAGSADPSTELDQMLRALLADRGGDLFTATAVQERLGLGVISNRSFERGKGIRSTREGMVAADGVFYGGDLGSLTKHAEIGDLAAAAGRLRGSFALGVGRGDSLTLFTDHFSTRPLYFLQAGKALYFSSELKALLPVGGKKHADVHAFREAFALGYVCGSKTLVKEIKRLGPGGYLQFSVEGAGLRVGSYYSAFDYQRKRGTDPVELTAAGLNTAVGRAVKAARGAGYTVLATLSAGLDSRVVCALASEFVEGGIETLTYGEPESFEIELAERVAGALGSRHRFVPYNGGGWLLDRLDQAVLAGEGMAHVIDVARMLHALEGVGAGMLHTGISGDFIFGSFVRSDDWERSGFTAEELSESVMERLGMGHWDGLVDLMNEVGEGASFLRGVRDSVMRTFDPALLERDWAGAHEVWNLRNRQIRGISGFFRGIEQSMEYATPFYDPELAAVGLGLPQDKRLHQRAYLKALKGILPTKLASLPWGKTGIPLVGERPAAGVFERARRAFRRRVGAKLSDEQWRRSSANPYQYWFATDRALRQRVVDELRPFERLPMLGLDQRKLASWLDDWLDDPRPRGRSLLHLIYLLPLKRWIDRYGAQVEL